MGTSKQNRIFYYDNLRFFLIATVVIGHFVDTVTTHSDLFKSVYLWIYAFHMPLFMYLSGMFHKNEKILPKVTRFIMIGFALRICIFLVGLVMNGNTGLKLFSTSGAPWYMFVLAGYTLLSYLTRKLDKRALLIFAIILGLFSGYDSSLGDTLYLSRFIVFYPFFLLGEMSSSGVVLKTVSKKWVRLLGIIVLAVWAAICIFKLDAVYILRPLFTGRNPFGSRFGTYAFLYRGLCYLITALVGFGVMCIIPQRKISVVSVFGSRTLQIYFWHVLVRDIISNLNVFELLGTSFYGKLIILLMGVAVTFVLGLKIFGFPTNQIVNLCRYAEKQNT